MALPVISSPPSPCPLRARRRARRGPGRPARVMPFCLRPPAPQCHPALVIPHSTGNAGVVRETVVTWAAVLAGARTGS